VEKDNTMSIFHGLGKFLYNKRMKKGAKLPEKCTSRELCVPANLRPKGYFSPSQIINTTNIEPLSFSLYLNENMPDFYGDINDYCETAEFHSSSMATLDRGEFNYSNKQSLKEIEDMVALASSMAVFENNLHSD
jgi:hypothetical protein